MTWSSRGRRLSALLAADPRARDAGAPDQGAVVRPLRGLPPLRVVIVALLGLFAVVECSIVLWKALDAPGFGLLARDFDLYMDATRRWMAGGPFYNPEQLAGPYDLPWGQIFYPPQALALFVPFTLLGPLLGPIVFIAIPAVITVAVIWSYRPGFWAWAAILLVVVLHPDAPLIWIAGTPTIWVVALVALATRWPWVSGFIWFKPSVFPFALIGIRDRRWWLITGAFAVSAVLLWPLMTQWATTVLNARGENSGLLYSLSPTALADPLLPVIAWLGRQRELAERHHVADRVTRAIAASSPRPGVLMGRRSRRITPIRSIRRDRGRS